MGLTFILFIDFFMYFFLPVCTKVLFLMNLLSDNNYHYYEKE